jgi:hypothetical protein
MYSLSFSRYKQHMHDTLYSLLLSTTHAGHIVFTLSFYNTCRTHCIITPETGTPPYIGFTDSSQVFFDKITLNVFFQLFTNIYNWAIKVYILFLCRFCSLEKQPSLEKNRYSLVATFCINFGKHWQNVCYGILNIKKFYLVEEKEMVSKYSWIRKM